MCVGPCIRVECAYLDLDLGGPVWETSVWGKLFCWRGQQVGDGSFTEGGAHHWPAGARPIAWSSGTSFIDRQAREVTNDGCSPPPPPPISFSLVGPVGGKHISTGGASVTVWLEISCGTNQTAFMWRHAVVAEI